MTPRSTVARRLFGSLLAVVLCAPGTALPQATPQEGSGGRAVLERMHATYVGRWYEHVAFVQRTTIIRAGGARDTATWYESLKGPDVLRIDFGAPAGGRGVIFTAESIFVFRDARLARADTGGNALLPLAMGVYLQPIEATERALARYGFDLGKMYETTWNGGRAYVVGAASARDTVSPQFVVDSARLLVVRVRMPGKGGATLDVQLDHYVAVGGGWLERRVAISLGGAPVQLEEYTEWSDRVAIPDSLFARRRWVTGGHWAAVPRAPALWQHAP